jgi:hypothetical protein
MLEGAIGGRGINVSNEAFSDTDYADDIAALNHSIDLLCKDLSNIDEYSKQLGLRISWAKTKVQNIGAGDNPSGFVVNGNEVECVRQFTYLGSSISSESGSRAEQLRRIGIASSVMQSLSCIWKSSTLTLRTKIRLYSILVIPVLLYGSETWTMTKADCSKLQAFHMRCQRRIIGVCWQDKVRNTEVVKKTNLSNVDEIIQRRRHSLFGHVVRMNKEAPAHKAAKLCMDINEGRRTPDGWKRPPGRPRGTWLGQIRVDHGRPVSTSWRVAEDRNRWKMDAKALSGYAT